MRYMLVAILLYTTSGCGVGVTTLTSPNGTQYHRAKCKSSESDCLTEARNVCGGNFTQLSSESHAGGIIADIMPGPVTWYTMSFTCGGNDNSIPQFEFHGPTFLDAMAQLQRTYYNVGVTCTQYGSYVQCSNGVHCNIMGNTVTCY